VTQDVKLRLSVSGQAQVQQALGGVETSIGRVDAVAERAGSTLRSFVGALGVGLSVKAFLDAADAVTTLQNQLKLATGSAREAAAAYDELFAIAQRSRTGFTELGATYASIARAGQALGLSQTRLLGVTEAIGNAMTISGGSAAGMQAALVQLGQGLASGALRGDELNSVMEQAPRLARALADGLGVTTGELRALGAAGEITAQKVIQALEKSAPQLAREVQDSTLTVGQAFTVLTNSATRFAGEADRAAGASSALASALKGVSGALDSIGAAMKEYPVVTSLLAGTLVGAGAVAAVTGIATAIKSVAVAVGALNLALAANPVTLALLGLGAAVGGAVVANNAYRKTADGMRATLQDLKRDLQEIETYGGKTESAAARAAAKREQILRLQVALQQLEAGDGAGYGRGSAQMDDYRQQVAETTAAEKALADVRAKLADVDADYTKTVNALADARRLGLIPEAEYVSLVKDVVQAMTKKSAAGKADAEAAREAARAAAETLRIKKAAAEAEKRIEEGFRRENEAATDREISRAVSLREQVRQQQEANAAIGLTAAAVSELEAVRLRETAATKDSLAATLDSVSPDIARAYREQAASLRELADAKLAGGRKSTAEAALNDLGLGAKDVRQALDLSSLREAASGLSDPLSQVVAQFQTMIDLQAQFGEQAARIAEAKQGDAAQQARALQAEAKLASQIESARLGGYASLAGAAKGFFAQNSKGYKALAAAEKAFRVMELASAAQSAATKLGFIGAEVTAKVGAETTKAAAVVAGQAVETSAVTAGEAARNTAKIPGVFMAFMSALGPWGMAAASVAIAAVLGGAFGGRGSTKVDAGNTGTGTVFGDKDAKSESISKSLDLLAEVDTKTMRYSAEMAASLRNIEANIGGLTNLLIRSGRLEDVASSVQTGTRLSGSLGAVNDIASRFTELAFLGTGLDKILGGIAGSITKKLFGTTTKVKGLGIYAADQMLGDVLSKGFDASYYVDVNKKKKAFGVTYSNKNKTKLTDADPELERQFSLIFEGFADAISAAAGPLGASLSDVEQRLQTFVVKIGKINLKGLNGEEIQEKLSAVFGAAGDDIARAALAGYEAYQQVGEGYLETVVRVATTTETVRETLLSLRGTVLELGQAGTSTAMALVDAFGDLDAYREQTSAYLEAYYSDSERAAITTRQLSEALQRLGINTLPSTKEAYRALVDAQDLTTESGREAYAALIGLSTVFADLLDLVDDVNASLVDAVSEAREKLIGAYEREADTLTSTVDRFRDFGKSLRDFRDSLLVGNLSPLTPAQQYAQVKAQFGALSAAAALGDETALSQLQAAAQALLTQSQSYNAGSAAYLADFESVQDALSNAAISALATADVAQLQLDAINDQLELLGRIDESAITIADAMTGLRDAVAAALAAGATPGSLGPLPSFDVGTNYVPSDMVATIHRGERIIPAADNAALMQRLSDPSANGDALVAEVRALRAEVQQLREQNNQGHAANAAATERTAQKVADGVSRAAHAASLQARATIR